MQVIKTLPLTEVKRGAVYYDGVTYWRVVFRDDTSGMWFVKNWHDPLITQYEHDAKIREFMGIGG